MSIADRAVETTNTTGTGTLTLAGAVSKYQSFSSAFTNKQLVDYVIESGTDWEIGLGTFTTSGTTLSRDIIRRSSNSGAAISVAAGAKVWADIGADNFTSSVQMFRNRLYNGQFRFDQVNEGTVYTASGSAAQGPDGWTVSAIGAGTLTLQRVADPDNASLFALKVACTVADASIAAGDLYQIFTSIEGYDVADLKAGTANAAQITVSFDMKFDVTGVYPVSIRNSAVNRSYVGTVTQNVASTLESKVVTLTLDTSGTWLYTNGAGLFLTIGLAVGSTAQTPTGVWAAGNFIGTSSVGMANFMSVNTNVGYIKRIQVEKGPVATPFEEISYAADLLRTQRYAEKTYEQGTAVGTATNICEAMAAPFLATLIPLPSFAATKRASPTMTGYGPITGTAGKWYDAVATETNITSFTTGAMGRGFLTMSAGSAACAGHFYANARLT